MGYGGVGAPPPGGDLEDPPLIAERPRLLTGEVLVSVALKTDTVCHLSPDSLRIGSFDRCESDAATRQHHEFAPIV